MTDEESTNTPAGEPFWAAQEAQQSVIVDMWVAAVGQQHELVDGLLGLFEKLRLVDGFVDGGIYASLDGTKVLSYSRMRSATDQQLARNLEDIRERLRALEAIALPHRDYYELAWMFTPPADGGPDSVSYGAL